MGVAEIVQTWVVYS